jgi:hypothetical protein
MRAPKTESIDCDRKPFLDEEFRIIKALVNNISWCIRKKQRYALRPIRTLLAQSSKNQVIKYVINS